MLLLHISLNKRRNIKHMLLRMFKKEIKGVIMKKQLLKATIILTLLILVCNLFAQQNNYRNTLKKEDVKWLNPEEIVTKVYPEFNLKEKITLKGQFIDADFAQTTKNLVVAEKYNGKILIHFFNETGHELWSRQVIGNQKEGLIYISKNGKTIVYNAVYLIDEESSVYDITVMNNRGEIKGNNQKSDWDLKPSESGEELYIMTNLNHEVKPIKKLMYYDTSLNKHYFIGFNDDATSVSYKVINDSLLISFKDFLGNKPQLIEFYKKNKDSISLINQYELSGTDGSAAPFCLERCFQYNREIIYYGTAPYMIFDYEGKIIYSGDFFNVKPTETVGFFYTNSAGIAKYIGDDKSKLSGIEIDFLGKVYESYRIDKVMDLNNYIMFYENKKVFGLDILSFYHINDKTSFSYEGKTYLTHPEIKIFQEMNNLYFFGRQK